VDESVSVPVVGERWLGKTMLFDKDPLRDTAPILGTMDDPVS
jgi:hypothetical protein